MGLRGGCRVEDDKDGEMILINKKEESGWPEHTPLE